MNDYSYMADVVNSQLTVGLNAVISVSAYAH
jgi:hypothetical protein